MDMEAGPSGINNDSEYEDSEEEGEYEDGEGEYEDGEGEYEDEEGEYEDEEREGEYEDGEREGEYEDGEGEYEDEEGEYEDEEEEEEYGEEKRIEYVEQTYVREPGKTDLDEFLENYKANPLCLLQILSFLDFDECGYTRQDDSADESLENNPSVKRIYPSEGFCVRAITLEGCVVFINICHCDDIQSPSNALLDTLLNMTDDPPIVSLPLSLGKPHRERNDDGRICIAFDIILNTRFYEQQVNKYELLRAYILSLCITGINDKYYNTIRAESCVKMGRLYHGTMPKQYIDRKMSAFIEDQVMVKLYTQAKAARVVKWAKTSAMKRLQRLRNYKQRKFRAPVRLSARSKPEASIESKPSTSGMRTRSCKSPPNEPSTSSQAVFPRIQKDEIDSLRGMEYLDMEGIVRIGIHVESNHLPYPTIIPPGSLDDSIDLLYKLEYDDIGYNLEYELFHLCDNDQVEYLAITDLPQDTNLEDIAIFASRDGLIVCDKDAKRYFEITLPFPLLPMRIKITVNCLNMTISMPVVRQETPCEPDEEDQEVPNLSD